jgi:hypothetical protein
MGRIGFEVKQLLKPFLDRGPFCIGDYVSRAITYFFSSMRAILPGTRGISLRLSHLQAAQPVFVVWEVVAERERSVRFSTNLPTAAVRHPSNYRSTTDSTEPPRW